ncbi:hypothetical protein EDD85DRAFT_498809 [Armillaria nabsnona]|nr:hypothetical protein EDD85DRAFT_498809 [Armillaria nabsnona]
MSENYKVGYTWLSHFYDLGIYCRIVRARIIEARRQNEVRLPETTISSFYRSWSGRVDSPSAETTYPHKPTANHSIIPCKYSLQCLRRRPNAPEPKQGARDVTHLGRPTYLPPPVIHHQEHRLWHSIRLPPSTMVTYPSSKTSSAPGKPSASRCARATCSTTGSIPPRRIWDLFKNVSFRGGSSVCTHAWPVPIPHGVDLHLLRIKLLELGAEFVWVDVFCLRPLGGLREDLRELEWRLEVPSIGFVYDGFWRWFASIGPSVHYLNGLGRPIGGCVDLESERSWFQRAWTLQEMSNDYLIGGEMSEGAEEGHREELAALRHINGTPDVTNLACPLSTSLLLNVRKEMQIRVSTNPRDKVARLFYLFLLRCIPVYSASQKEEDAWNVIVREMDLRVRGQPFVLHPCPGPVTRQWSLSWEQVMTEEFRLLKEARTGCGRIGSSTEKMEMICIGGITSNRATSED